MRFEGLRYHKMRLAFLILDDEERTAKIVEVEGPHGPHGAVARVTLPQPAETMPELRAHLPLQGYLLLLDLHTGSQEAGEVVWYSHLFKNFPQFVVIHTVKGYVSSAVPNSYSEQVKQNLYPHVPDILDVTELTINKQ